MSVVPHDVIKLVIDCDKFQKSDEPIDGAGIHDDMGTWRWMVVSMPSNASEFLVILFECVTDLDLLVSCVWIFWWRRQKSPRWPSLNDYNGVWRRLWRILGMLWPRFWIWSLWWTWLRFLFWLGFNEDLRWDRTKWSCDFDLGIRIWDNFRFWLTSNRETSQWPSNSWPGRLVRWWQFGRLFRWHFNKKILATSSKICTGQIEDTNRNRNSDVQTQVSQVSINSWFVKTELNSAWLAALDPD